MVKKIIFSLLAVIIQSAAFANFNDVLIANIEYDWINKNALEKESIISEVHDIMFENPITQRNDLKSLFSDRLKDKNYKENYYAASAGFKEYKGNNISAFYFKRFKNIYMYAIQDKKDITKNFYYDALGNLKYVDFIDGDYPDYPYSAIQYRISGKPVSAIYYVSKDCQYLFKPNGEFEGVWFKHKLYNGRNKVILTRTTY
ncbi:hypothetical protein IJ750_04090 [bacterium]|nr:hypothetical protein [bacterium]